MTQRGWALLLTIAAVGALLVWLASPHPDAPERAGTTRGSGSGTSASLVAVGEVQITRTTSGHQIAGRVKNQATRPYSGQVTVTLFDGGGKIIGTYLGAVNDVAPGDEVTYLAIGTEHPETWAKVEAKVTLQIPR